MCTAKELFLEERITIYLLILKITPHLRGHDIFKNGVKKIVEDISKKHNVKNRLYNEIAEENNMAVDLIDRAMRHSIDVSMKRNGISEFEKRVKVDFKNLKPTPRELLCTMAEKIIVEYNLYIAKKKMLF